MFDKKFLLDEIKNFVTIQDIFEKYVGTTPDTHGRYQCPFNDTEDRRNFGIKRNQFWHCFSCGSSGDQITLVQKLYDLSFNDAMIKIAEDFGLAVEPNKKMSKKLRIEMQRKLLQKEKDKRRERFLVYKSNELFKHIIGLQRILQEVIKNTDPNDLTRKYYMYNNKSKINMEARARMERLEYYLDVLCEMPLRDDKDGLTYEDKDALHARATRLIKAYIEGDLTL